MPSFYNGKRFFLTYARCESLPADLVGFLQSRADVRYYLVARELHEDGTPHLHACVEFTNTERHGVDWLDFEGKHPNKQDPRKWEACKQYCKKDGEFLEDAQTALDNAVGALAPSLECASFETQKDWFDHCMQNKYAFAYATWMWDYVHPDSQTMLDDTYPGAMVPHLQAFKFVHDLHRCLILVGDSGCGKTTWAKINAPKPALFVCHIDDMKLFRKGYHVSIIFDDVSFAHIPVTAQIHLCDFDNPRSIHCRHTVARIPAGVWKIFTCNAGRLPLITSDPAIKRRVKVVNVK